LSIGEIKKIIGNDYEVTVMVPAGKYWKWPSKEDRIFYERLKRLKLFQLIKKILHRYKVADITLEILRGTFVIMSPSPNIGWGGVYPLSHWIDAPV